MCGCPLFSIKLFPFILRDFFLINNIAQSSSRHYLISFLHLFCHLFCLLLLIFSSLSFTHFISFLFLLFLSLFLFLFFLFLFLVSWLLRPEKNISWAKEYTEKSGYRYFLIVSNSSNPLINENGLSISGIEFYGLLKESNKVKSFLKKEQIWILKKKMITTENRN